MPPAALFAGAAAAAATFRRQQHGNPSTGGTAESRCAEYLTSDRCCTALCTPVTSEAFSEHHKQSARKRAAQPLDLCVVHLQAVLAAACPGEGVARAVPSLGPAPDGMWLDYAMRQMTQSPVLETGLIRSAYGSRDSMAASADCSDAPFPAVSTSHTRTSGEVSSSDMLEQTSLSGYEPQPGRDPSSGVQLGIDSEAGMRRIRSDTDLCTRQALPDALLGRARKMSNATSPLGTAMARRGGHAATPSGMPRAASCTDMRRSSGHDWICALEFHSQRPLLLAASVRKAIDLYALAVDSDAADSGGQWLAGPPRTVHRAPAKLACAEWCVWAPDAIMTGDYDGVLYRVDLTTGHVLAEIDEHHGHRLCTVRHSRLRRNVAASAGDDGGVRLWGGSLSETHLARLGSHLRVCSMAFSESDADLLVTGDASGYVSVWDLRQTMQPLQRWQAHGRPCCHVALSGGLIVSAGTDSILRVWQPQALPAAPPKCVRQLQGHINVRNFVGMCVRNDGVIACGSESGCVHIYGVQDAQRQPHLVCPHGCVSAVAWGRSLGPSALPLLATGCSDGSVQVQHVL
jgi:WD40 repeat protein